VVSLKPGDRVMGSCGHGAFAEKVLVKANKTLRIPDGIDFDVAAAFTLTYGTSWHALADRAALAAGETLLVLGAAGGVGLAAIEIGKALGARVIAAASSPEKLAVCREHGADALIDYAREDLREAIKRETAGNGPDVIYDPVGGQYAEPAFRSIAWRGRYLVIGFANGEIPRLPLNLALLKGASIVGVFWGAYTAREPDRFAADLEEMFGRIAKGELRPHISRRYPLAEGARALEDLMNRRAIGKLVIVP
jgi:NADPH2:quinone reductase